MPEERERGETTESTERIPPGSMPPDDDEVGEDQPDEPTDEEKVDKESEDSFPASDPPAW